VSEAVTWGDLFWLMLAYLVARTVVGFIAVAWKSFDASMRNGR
jgi:hypothetical protein